MIIVMIICHKLTHRPEGAQSVSILTRGSYGAEFVVAVHRFVHVQIDVQKVPVRLLALHPTDDLRIVRGVQAR